MKPIVSLLLTCIALFAGAQSTPSVFKYNTAVSFNPSLLMGPDYTAMFGMEHRLKNNLALVMDAGYVFSSSYFNGSILKSAGGFNLRPGIRIYTKEEKRFYLQLQVFYKRVDYKIYDFLGKSCVNEIPTYEQLQNFTYRKNTFSFNPVVGSLFRISDKVLLEIYAGLGAKIKNQRTTEEATCYRNNQSNFLNLYRPHSVAANLPLGIKIIFPLK